MVLPLFLTHFNKNILKKKKKLKIFQKTTLNKYSESFFYAQFTNFTLLTLLLHKKIAFLLI